MSSAVRALNGVANACQLLPAVVTGGQPTAAHLAAFQAAGGRIVLDVRDPMEPRPLDEVATAEALGMEYVKCRRPPQPDGFDADRILEVLRRAGDRLILTLQEMMGVAPPDGSRPGKRSVGQACVLLGRAP
jgi:hypothetical protein